MHYNVKGRRTKEVGDSWRNMLAFHRDPLTVLSQAAQSGAPVTPIPIARWTLYLITGPDELAHVFNHHVRVLEKGPGMDRDNPLIGRGLLLSETPWWEESRRQIKGALAPSRVRLQSEVMAKTIQAALDRWPDGDLDVFPELIRLTAAVVVSSLFQGSLGPDTFGVLIKASENLMDFFYHRTRSFVRPPYSAPWPFNRQFSGASHALNETADLLYAQKDVAPSEFLERLQEFSPDDRRAQIITFLIAGHETTANALGWTLDLLARHPEAQLKARQDPAWLEASINESLRLYPPIWLMSRKTLVAMDLGEYHIPAKTSLLLSPWVNHRVARYFPQPEKFAPERWIKQPDPIPYTYFPFGAGQRSCIGEVFARQELRLTIEAILARWTLSPLSPSATAPLPRMSLRPEGGIGLRLVPITNP